MNRAQFAIIITYIILFMISGCTRKSALDFPVDIESSIPGGTVTLNGATVRLTGTPLQVGKSLPAAVLIDAFTMKKVDLTQLKGKILILSVVPSLDPKVCEAQTHFLGELGASIPADIVRITISRDTPFAQKRFAEEAKLSGITYLSDYRDGSFGRSTGLLQEESMLLARALILVDKGGIVRHIQVVPELTHFPDLKTVFNKASALHAGK